MGMTWVWCRHLLSPVPCWVISSTISISLDTSWQKEIQFLLFFPIIEKFGKMWKKKTETKLTLQQYTLSILLRFRGLFYMSSHYQLFIKIYFSKHKRISDLCISSAHKVTTNTIFMKITVKYSFWMLIIIKNSFEESNLIGRFVHDKIKTNSSCSFFQAQIY